ncbi:protein ALP1-like [Salvia hispanica]|uniref:protein ALP1-like n=1 Tax=Salvia hispanica TaxID=49212 RepID=UPI0020090C16|nr:protein ALP1-like [Salvia hispanica]
MEARDEYFQQREDAAHRRGLSLLTKCTVALRQLAYGTTTDMFDEYLHVGDTTGRECLVKFCEGVIDAFSATYLRKPNAEDCQYLMGIHDRVHGFPGMLGSIDCMHWEWKNCPAAWRGQFTSGYKSTHPIMILEAIVDHCLWSCHAHFGVAESNNDINVLNSWSLFTEQYNGNGPVIKFTANGRQHHMGYYLADDIYPRWPVFLKTISCPTDARRELFASRQEAARKDVERGFSVLQARWAIVKGSARSWYRHHIANVMYACIILHNMIIHDEGRTISDWFDDEAGPSAGHATPPVI